MREPGPRLHGKLLLLSHAQVTQQAVQPQVHLRRTGSHARPPGTGTLELWACRSAAVRARAALSVAEGGLRCALLGGRESAAAVEGAGCGAARG